MNPVMAENVVCVQHPYGRKKKTLPVIIQNQILETLAKHPYKLTFRGFVGEYNAYRSRVALTCECGRELETSADKVIRGSGCRSCGSKKFRDNRHYLYVLQCGDIGKVGVTSDPVRRLAKVRHKNGLDFKLVHHEELTDKETAFRREALIKRLICCGGEFDIAAGRTETFLFNQKTLNNIKNLAKRG
ncbi:hypothetical protein J9089_003271 [Salmonella enterica]|nr:hypothetical protein [Salmonella enterica]EHI7757802.1 hypothetical protein [Salmonella enterica]EHI8762945.1 hypothetical protein [Salmonella enterica]